MKRFTLSFAVFLVLSTSAWATPPQGEVTLRLRDGRTKTGRILSETSSGYLVAGTDGTEVIAYANLTDIQPAAAAVATVPAPVVPAAIPPPPPPTAPVAVAAPAQPADVAVYDAPPPAGYAPTEVAAVSDDWVERRLGRHFGFGANVMAAPGYGTFSAQFHIDWTFGRVVGLRVSPQLAVSSLSSTTCVSVGADTVFQVNVGQHYAFGVGVQLGLAFGGFNGFYLGPTVAPAIVKLGDRGQHQIQLTVSVPLLHVGSGYDFVPPNGGLGYSFFF